jgi:phospholipid N-methyltransferase
MAGCGEVVHAGVEELPENEPYDVIISGLPLNNFTPDVVHQILGKLRRLLAPGGTLSFFEYIGMRPLKAAISRRADKHRVQGVARVLDCVLTDHEIRRDRVLANVPPAWVHHVRFGEQVQ